MLLRYGIVRAVTLPTLLDFPLAMLSPTAPESIDVGFVLTCSALVFLMQAGFCMLESGMIRAKNSINVAVKNLLDFAISMLAFAAFGFSIMFGASHFGLVGSHVPFWSDNELGAFFLYQMVFCGTAATIVSGAVAERTKLNVYLAVVLLLSGITYPLIGHWCWGGVLGNTGSGWLAALGFVDWAGATVVHVVGGFASLAAIIVIGPRRNYRAGTLTSGHSLTLAIMGCFLLWFGWWGFNGGSGLNAGNNVSLVILNTNLGAVAGLLAAAIRSLIKTGKTNVIDVISGALAGLVSVTGACHVISPIAAMIAGVVGAIIALVAIDALKNRGIDDAVGAFGIHGAAGSWGTIVFAIFTPTVDLATSTRMTQLAVQSLGAFVAATFAFATTYVGLRLMARFTKLRVKAGEEKLGLNVVEHGATNEVTDLLGSMSEHQRTGEFTTKLEIDTDSEVGQIAAKYNAVIERVEEEVHGHDLTNRTLQSEKLRLQSVLEHAGVGIYQLDESGHFQSANTTLLETFGYSSVSEIDQKDTPFLIPWNNDCNETTAKLREYFSTGKAIKDLETQCTAQNGDTQWLLESIVPIRDDNGRLLTWLGTVHDVTERKQAMLAAVEIAEAKSKAKGEFLANMSHEIRTPLNGVIGMLDLMATGNLERREGNYVSIARSSAETLLALINDVLDFSKIEAGKLELESVDFDLRELVESTAEHFAVRAHMKGLEMNCELASGLPYRVTGDPERLRQVIVNLMGNAVKFTEQGEVNLRVSRRGDVIRFAVQDTGIGISADAQESLFESFVQADVSTTRRYGGTGLGLSIGNQLVKKMGGNLKVDSEMNQGSEFWFELPMPIVEPQTPEVVETQQLRSELSNLNVLIIDDNHTNCEILQNQLSNWGLQSSVCNQSTAAVQKMLVAERLEKPFDLVILDFCMPDMNGHDVANEFQRHPSLSAVPIIMLSSNHDLLPQAELSKAGIDIAMTKPARQSRLFDSIVSLAYRRQEQPSLQPSPPTNDVATRPLVSDQSPPVLAPIVEPSTMRQSNLPEALTADVLIAEDNEVNQMVVQQMLETLGYSCEVAGDGERALKRVQSGRYSLVLMDGHMPVMDGLTASKQIREWEQELQATGIEVKRTPIVALTANVISGVRQNCLDAGMDDYLCKPITLERLKEVALKFAGKGTSAQQEPSQGERTHMAQPHFTPAVVATPANADEPSSPIPMAEAVDPAWLDQTSLLNRCGGDVSFQNQILTIMRDTLPTRVSDLREAGQQNDWPRIRAIAHQLRGAAGDSSLIAVQEAAGTLEDRAVAGNPTAIEDAIADLETRIETTLDFLDRSLN